MDSLDLATAEDHVHSHIPYGALCLLADTLGAWPGMVFAPGMCRGENHARHAGHRACTAAWLHSTLMPPPPAVPTCRPTTPPPPSPAVLLAKAAKQWQAEHGGALPSSTAERSAFKELIKGWQRDIDGIPLEVRLC